MKMKGKVYLVGAGPGDPSLITVKGKKLLRTADVVVVDALVDPTLFKSIHARIIFVGKRGPGAPMGAYKNFPQSKINEMLVKFGQAGYTVVRLKGGDPFVFGRGSEEIEALKNAGLAFEVVPGVSSATGVPALAGIPVTDRRWSSQVTFVTGQEGRGEEATAPKTDWAHLPQHGTLVVFMGVNRWTDIQKKLLRAGWPAEKLVTAIQSGTTPDQKIIDTTLGRSNLLFKWHGLTSPALIIIGDVVRFRNKFIQKSNKKNLSGRIVVATRSEDRNAEFISLLQKQGAFVVSCPLIQVKPLDRSLVRTTLSRMKNRRGSYDWLIFLSSNGVDTFSKLISPNSSLFKKTPVLAIGPKTAERAKQLGWKIKKIAHTYNSVGVVNSLGAVQDKKIIIPRAQKGPRDIVDLLKDKGALVDVIETYKTQFVKPKPAIKKMLLNGADAVSFTSSSTVLSFVRSFTSKEREKIFRNSISLSIGPMTTRTLRKNRFKNIVEAHPSTIEGMIKALKKKLAG
jgi:uroporphyrinogen III methyltransferase/synthase